MILAYYKPDENGSGDEAGDGDQGAPDNVKDKDDEPAKPDTPDNPDEGQGDEGAGQPDESGDEGDPDGSSPDDDGDGDGDDSSDNPYGTMMQSLVDSEVFEVIDEDKGYTPDEEGFKNLVEDTVNSRLEKAVEDKLSSRNETVVEIENFLSENEGATLDDYINEQQEFDYNTVDETNAQHAVYLLEDFYKLQGYKPDEIKETLREHHEAKSIGRHAKKAKAAIS